MMSEDQDHAHLKGKCTKMNKKKFKAVKLNFLTSKDRTMPELTPAVDNFHNTLEQAVCTTQSEEHNEKSETKEDDLFIEHEENDNNSEQKGMICLSNDAHNTSQTWLSYSEILITASATLLKSSVEKLNTTLLMVDESNTMVPWQIVNTLDDSNTQDEDDAPQRAQNDCIERAQIDFTARTLHDSRERAMKDSTERAMKDSTERAMKDSTERAMKDSTERAMKDSTERAMKDSTERAMKDSTERATQVSTDSSVTNSKNGSKQTLHSERHA
ncbi:uncharacterized protein [Scyliorhinus torazame]|uniref:uncharacterized protein n=1 Tax=Scyliorhinus torazame TaxID=75743 RepID=UPI003B5C32FE